MSRGKKPPPGVNPVRTFPYFKIQTWEDRRAVWIDIQKKFATLDNLRAYAERHLSRDTKARVVVVEGYGKRHVDQSLDVFSD